MMLEVKHHFLLPDNMADAQKKMVLSIGERPPRSVITREHGEDGLPLGE